MVPGLETLLREDEHRVLPECRLDRLGIVLRQRARQIDVANLGGKARRGGKNRDRHRAPPFPDPAPAIIPDRVLPERAGNNAGPSGVYDSPALELASCQSRARIGQIPGRSK
jgi:hypothetical protein